MSNVAIKVDHISKSFKLPHERQSSIKSALISLSQGKRQGFERQQVLDNVSFEVAEGEFFGIVGRNGSGKSTLLKLLAGIYTPSKGAIHINGKLTPFIELGVGFNADLTGRENVYLNGALLGFSRKEMEAMYDDIVEFAELKRFMDQKLKNYSSGMQVRLAFSVAIRANTGILLLDEVLAVGDAAFQQKCFNYFEELKKNKKTVVFVSHDMSAVKRFCTKALFIEQGKIKHIGKPEEIADEYLVENIAKKKMGKDGVAKSRYVQGLGLSLSSPAKLAREGGMLKLKAHYELLQDFTVVLGISIIRDGISVAEINSRATELASATGKAHTANLDVALDSFNPGLYSLNIAIFNESDMEMLDYVIDPVQFVITGNDPTRGAATYIKGGWSQ